MHSAYEKFRWRCIQKMIAGGAVALAGLVLMFTEIRFGEASVPGNQVLGIVIAIAGALYAVSAAAALRQRKKPSARR